MPSPFEEHLIGQLAGMRHDGLYKRERLIGGRQGVVVNVVGGRSERAVVNLCANNYLGLASHPEVVTAAKRGLDVRPRRLRLRLLLSCCP